MKKIIALLVLALSLFSTTFSAEKLSPEAEAYINELGRAFVECKLKAPRWMFVTSLDEKANKVLFYDRQSIASPYYDEKDVWVGIFYRGKDPCEYPGCKEKNFHSSKHYHLSRWRLNARLMQYKVLSVATRDENYNLVDSFDIPSYLQEAKTIMPDTIGEQVLNEIKDSGKETTAEKLNGFDMQKIKPPSSEKLVYQIGDKGWKIKQAQQYLLKLGFEPGEADGRFTKSTRIALRKFQHKYHLKDTGDLDNATYEELKWQAEAKDYKKK
jgi:hypothetical protein